MQFPPRVNRLAVLDSQVADKAHVPSRLVW